MKMTVNQMVRRVVAVVALVLVAFGFVGSAAGECRFVAALNEGLPQKIVCYGTSLTVLSSNWVDGLQETLDARWPGLATVVNSGLSGQNSATGLAQVQTKVVAKNPDAVLVEGDVLKSTNTTPDVLFPVLPEPGDYWFSVATRGGRDDGYKLALARKRIKIV